MRAASHWPIGIISTTPFSWTGNRGKYSRVLGIYSDGCIDSLLPVSKLIRNKVKTCFETSFELCRMHRYSRHGHSDLK